MPELPDLAAFARQRKAEAVDPDNIEGPPKIVMPAQLAGPANTPVHVEVMGAYDERGVWWIVLRAETIHGSHITFLVPEVAKNVAADIEVARGAQAFTPFVPPPTET